MITPQEFYEETVGKQWDIDHAYGVQCHDLAQKCCDDLGIPKDVIWCGNTGYAHDVWDRRKISGIYNYFYEITDPNELQNGDMVVFPTNYSMTPLSHICFYYEFNGKKYAFGQRQGGNREARLVDYLDFNHMAGAFRPIVWANGGDEMNPGKFKGCDVSEWNDPEAIDITPYDYVIIRAAWYLNEDKRLNDWVNKCKACGKPYGFYQYSYALSVEQAKAEARFFLNVISKYRPQVGCWLDMEDADSYKKNNGALYADLITQMCAVWCEIVEGAGYYTGIYASQSWFGYYIKTEETKRWDKWVASWGNNDGNINRDTSYLGTMLQYTSHGGLDKDITYIDLKIYDIAPKEDEGKTDKERIEELEKKVGELEAKIEWYLSQMGKTAVALKQAEAYLSGEA